MVARNRLLLTLGTFTLLVLTLTAYYSQTTPDFNGKHPRIVVHEIRTEQKCPVAQPVYASSQSLMRDWAAYAYPFDVFTDYSLPSNIEKHRMATRNPFFITLENHGDLISRTIRERGVWDGLKLNFLEKYFDKLVARGRKPASITYVDIGANIGALAFPMYTMGAKVVMVEPLQSHIAMLRSTALANDFSDEGRLFILPFAFGNETGTGEIEVLKSNHGGSSLIHEKAKMENVGVQMTQSVQLDQLDQWINFPVDIMKIDVEGMEKCVIEGASRMFFRRQVQCIVIEVWNALEFCNTAAGLLQWMENQGYAVYHEDFWADALADRPPPTPWHKVIARKGNFIEWILVRQDAPRSIPAH